MISFKRVCDIYEKAREIGLIEFIVVTGFVLNVIIVSSCLVPFLPDQAKFALEKGTDFGITVISVILGIWAGLQVNAIWSHRGQNEQSRRTLIMFHFNLVRAVRENDIATLGYILGFTPVSTPDFEVINRNLERLYEIEDEAIRQSVHDAVNTLSVLNARHAYFLGKLQANQIQEANKDKSFQMMAHDAIGVSAYREWRKDSQDKYHTEFTNDGVGEKCIKAIHAIERKLRSHSGWTKFDEKRIADVINQTPFEIWAAKSNAPK